MTDQALAFHAAHGRPAVGAAPVVREAALAVHGTGAVPRDVQRRPMPAGAALRRRAPRRAPGGRGLPAAGGMPELPARRLHPHRAPGLPGADRAARPPPGPAVRRAWPRSGRLDDTLVVFTADHGDFLGDHWLGEKELFYDTVQRIPFIVADPRPAADATRGSADEPFRRRRGPGADGAGCARHRRARAAHRRPQPGAAAARPAGGRLARFHLQRARLQLPRGAAAAGQAGAAVPRVQHPRRALALRVLARRTRAAVRPARRPAGDAGPGPRRRPCAAACADARRSCSTSWRAGATARR